MNALFRRWKLFKLKCRAFVLQAEADNAEGLLHDHNRRYRNTLRELHQVRNRIALLEEPQVLLRKIA